MGNQPKTKLSPRMAHALARLEEREAYLRGCNDLPPNRFIRACDLGHANDTVSSHTMNALVRRGLVRKSKAADGQGTYRTLPMNSRPVEN